MRFVIFNAGGFRVDMIDAKNAQEAIDKAKCLRNPAPMVQSYYDYMEPPVIPAYHRHNGEWHETTRNTR